MLWFMQIIVFKTDKYHDLHKAQHVLDFMIICTHLQDKPGKYFDLYKPQHASIY
jgi:hypothetical protein